MKILYLHCFSGISGDMTVAALVDAGADAGSIEREMQKISLEPYEIKWSRVVKNGISALKFDVIPDRTNPPKHHRHYADIVSMIDNSGLSDKVKRLSKAIFARIGAAEAKIHQIPLEDIHFHEVGAIDSLVDIIGTALAVESLAPDRIVVSSVAVGSGTVTCDHGVYPVPAPATLELLKGVPLQASRAQVELTTPTGAGIIAAIADAFSDTLPEMVVEAIGYGAGTRDLPNQPNVLRAIVGSEKELLHVPDFNHHHAHFQHHHDHAEHQHQRS